GVQNRHGRRYVLGGKLPRHGLQDLRSGPVRRVRAHESGLPPECTPHASRQSGTFGPGSRGPPLPLTVASSWAYSRPNPGDRTAQSWPPRVEWGSLPPPVRVVTGKRAILAIPGVRCCPTKRAPPDRRLLGALPFEVNRDGDIGPYSDRPLCSRRRR